MSNETNNSVGVELNAQFEHNRWGYTEKYLAHQQEYDLLGLALQTSNNSQPANGVEPFKEGPKAESQGLVSTCPVHSAILSNADILPTHVGELKHMPLDRYIAEGLVERYALLDVGPSDSGGQWARYSSCLCWQ
jgi:hypothetical protein